MVMMTDYYLEMKMASSMLSASHLDCSMVPSMTLAVRLDHSMERMMAHYSDPMTVQPIASVAR